MSADPIGDVATVRTEMAGCGMDLQGSTFVAYLVGFTAPGAAAAAVRRARADGWAAESYRAADRDVVRLFREGPATARDLEADRAYVTTFADEQGGQWEALALEQFGPDSYWDELAQRFIQKRSVASEVAAGDVPAQVAG